MKYLIDSYTAYMVNGGLLDKGSEVVNWFFIELPFFFLRMGAMIFLIMENVMNQSDYFVGKQQEAYDYSLDILKGFGGTGIVKGSLLGLAIILSAYYLLYSFFSNRRNFMKSLLHYFAVFALFICWFGQVKTIDGKTQNGAIFLISSVSEMTKQVQSKFTSNVNFGGDTSQEVDDGKKKVYQSPMFDATVLQTFNYVNSGSIDGKMANGKKLDYDKLLEKPGLSEDERNKFIDDRKQYIKDFEKDNPYFAQDTLKTMEKSFAVWTGATNLFILAIPVLYINLMLSLIQLLVVLLILVFPVVLLASFFPRCQMVLFKFFQGLVGVLFMPVVYGIFLSVLFWINKLIDGAFLGVAKKVSGSLLALISGSTVYMIVLFVAVVVKIVVLRKVWKNKYAILTYFSNGQVSQPVFEQKVKQVRDRTKEVATGGAEIALGAYTGNMGMVANGAGNILPNQDKAIEMGQEHFIDDNGEFVGVKSGLQSIFRQPLTEEEKGLMNEEHFSEVETESIDHELTDIDELGQRELDSDSLDKSIVELEPMTSEDLVVDSDNVVPDVDVELAPVEEVGEEPPVKYEESSDYNSVVVSNIDELAMAREERAYFDGGKEQELVETNGVESVNNIYPFVQTEEYLANLEQTEARFFGTNEFEKDLEQIEEWA
ncbi:hypothetical protein SHT65_00760 [Enterococcus faecalis]|jgi:hypothetical protein|uniref:hypothetical protein n=1 Tax=Enterococcus faecalis TaxID=1351 RepID=UPI00053583B1|nr:hypothetical protein [Enterococcus faecalis]EGO2593603.1 hypothetical protein [Enterococcus faecalis]EGO2603126.1 hypothetical protein [Enterococcus faecalis]EGO2620663.1 hypothetical protein [Enterococcus faecalis]EGO2675227.1 hypothetical protein [Enterococcus faecalis]EGO2720574.1 hypothetical protein [Enterococcus faecalis]